MIDYKGNFRVKRSRGILLTILLGYSAVCNFYLTFRYIAIYWDLVSHHDFRFPHWPFLAYAILSFVLFISICGIWQWKKWGFFFFIISHILGYILLFSLAEFITFWNLLYLLPGLIFQIILINLIKNKYYLLR